DPEERRDVAGRVLAAVIAEVEALGGTVTSVSGGGLQAMFGAPEAHEDDPERAARAAFRALAAVAPIDGGTLRIGVETGPAVRWSDGSPNSPRSARPCARRRAATGRSCW